VPCPRIKIIYPNKTQLPSREAHAFVMRWPLAEAAVNAQGLSPQRIVRKDFDMSHRIWPQLSTLALAYALLSLPPTASAQSPAPLSAGKGWVVMPTAHKFEDLVRKLDDAVKANKMGLVNAASASEGAKAQNVTIPGNRVIGVFRNDYARRMLSASIPAGIEAPIRFYITETAEGKATLSYRTPGSVFAPYVETAGPDLKKVADELDPIFAKIAEDATKP
jgi:uncharacterized protein (DUF302 family)